MSVVADVVTDVVFPCVRHFVSADGTHVFYEYEGRFTAAKCDDFGVKLHGWFTGVHGNPLVSLFVARTYAETSGRWLDVSVAHVFGDVVPGEVAVLSGDVVQVVVPVGKVVFL